METFRSLIAGHLTPAGEPVIWEADARPDPRFPEFSGYRCLPLDSGTSALALALLTAKARRGLLESDAPEVIVPAYCCPDLVAAADYAGVKVVVVDIAPEDPGYDLGALESALNDNTLAVIAVNFLGISERLDELAESLKAYPHIALIEDNAQWFPGVTEAGQLRGDYVVFSCGRGKPVSLLGGGLLLQREPAEPLPQAPAPANNGKGMTRLKHLAYNLLRRPQLYQFLTRNPLITLGETRYNPLSEVAAMDEYRTTLLARNVHYYRTRGRNAERAFDQLPRALNGLAALESGRRRRLLRYPVLLPSVEVRDELLDRLEQAGLGATAMYRQPLVTLPGLDRLQSQGPCPNAERFAERLLTLPVHSGVKPKHCEQITEFFTGYGA